MNNGGFSWRRFLGLSASQARLSRKLGVPMSKSGRQQKLGRARAGKQGLLAFIISVFFD
jgi:hypothetical protein